MTATVIAGNGWTFSPSIGLYKLPAAACLDTGLVFYDRFYAIGSLFDRGGYIPTLKQILHQSLHYALPFDFIQFRENLGRLGGRRLPDRHIVIKDELGFRIILEIRVGGERFADRQLGNVSFRPKVLLVFGPPL